MSEENRAQKAGAEDRKVSAAGLFHLAVVYVVWSSTYLAIRLTVQPGAGFPPFMMGLMRAAVSAAILLVWARLRGERLRLTKEEWMVLGISGLLLWTGGNGLVTWAEQRTESGFTALILASTPIWVAVLEGLLDRRPPSKLVAASLLLGIVGIGVLSFPEIKSGGAADLYAILGLAGAVTTWGVGSVLQSRRAVDVPVRVSAGYQMAAGTVGFAVLTRLMGEPLPTPTTEAWLAWGYLVVIGGVLAFTSYVSVLRMLPMKLVMTYAYVNPVLAVALGWVVLGEEITGWTVAGSALVLLGVAGVFRERYRDKG